MSKRGRQQSQRGHQGRNQDQMGRRQSTGGGGSWQSNDWSRNSQHDWNDGGIGGGDDRSRHMSGDDRWENHSNSWETDQGRASYDYDPSRNFGSSGQPGRDESGRGDYGRGFGDRGDYRTHGGSQGDWRGGQGRFGASGFGPGDYSQARDQDRYRSQSGDYGRGGFGQGQYGQGNYGGFGQRDYGQGNYGQGNYGQGNYGQGNFGQSNYGQSSYGQGSHRQGQFGGPQGEYGRQREHGQSGSFGSGMQNRGSGEGMGWGGHAGRGPKGYQRSDDRIREDVSDSLTDDPEVDASEITVEARDGEVTLTGTVQTREEKRAAEACAEEVSGVREVINQLRVTRGSGSNESSTSSSSGTSGRSQSGQSGKGSRGSSES